MRVPPFERMRRTSSALGIFVLGTVVGAALYNGILTAKFEALVNQNSMLEDTIARYEQEIAKLSSFKNQHSIIKSVVVSIEENRTAGDAKQPALDAVTEADLKRQIRRDLDVFIGQNIYDIDEDARFARLLLNRKVYTSADDGDYVVEIKTVLVVDNTLRVWVTARQRAPGPG